MAGSGDGAGAAAGGAAGAAAARAPPFAMSPAGAAVTPISPPAEGLDLHVGLVGLDLGDDVAALDGVAFLLQPLDDLAGLHGLAELGHQDLGDHAQTFRMASAILALEGVFSSSRLRAYGMGAFSPVTRQTGASMSSKASSL